MATEYIVLTQNADGDWVIHETVHAATAQAAIRSGQTAGTYVAVPARSWKPVTVKTETKTVLTLT